MFSYYVGKYKKEYKLIDISEAIKIIKSFQNIVPKIEEEKPCLIIEKNGKNVITK